MMRTCENHDNAVVVFATNHSSINCCPFCDVESHNAQLETKVDELNDQASELNDSITELTSRKEFLEAKVERLRERLESCIRN